MCTKNTGLNKLNCIKILKAEAKTRRAIKPKPNKTLKLVRPTLLKYYLKLIYKTETTYNTRHTS